MSQEDWHQYGFMLGSVIDAPYELSVRGAALRLDFEWCYLWIEPPWTIQHGSTLRADASQAPSAEHPQAARAWEEELRALAAPIQAILPDHDGTLQLALRNGCRLEIAATPSEAADAWYDNWYVGRREPSPEQAATEQDPP